MPRSQARLFARDAMTPMLRHCLRRRLARLSIPGFLGAILCVACSLSLAYGQTAARSVVFGVVLDGPLERVPITDFFRGEVTALLGSDFDVRFPPEKTVQGDWSLPSVEAGLTALLEDPDVDMVIALGVLASAAAASRESLAKPTIAPFVMFPELGDIPAEVRRGTPAGGSERRDYRVSGRRNLSYIAVRSDVRPGIEAFLEVVKFRHLAVVFPESLLESLPAIEQRFGTAAAPLGLTLDFVPQRGAEDDTVSRIPARSEAVFVGPLLGEGSDIKVFAERLVDRRLPSFSMLGRQEVADGILASIWLDTDLSRTARRTAINVQRILDGDPAAELPIDFDEGTRLSINMATARAIGARLTWATRTEAELLHDDERPTTRRLSLSDALREAERVNLDLAAADRTVAAGQQEVRLARSLLRPQIEASGSNVLIDSDRAIASLGSQGKNQLTGSVSLSQIIYSEQARAAYSVERTLQQSRELERSALRLDVIFETGLGYFEVLRTKTLERIQRQNLELTRRNLERARVRLELGDAGPAEVYRWRSEIANNRKDLIQASAVRNQAEIEVNRSLNRPLEESFATVETAIDDPALAANYEAFRPYVDNQLGFQLMRQFVAGRALAASPEIGQLDRAIEVQNRLLLAANRNLYVPIVSARAGVDTFRNDGAVSAGQLGAALGEGLEFPRINSLNWSLALQASLPLFQGGALRNRRTQARIELDELTLKREALRLRIEQRVRSAMHAAMASWAGIDLAREAAEAARSNLDIVADSYSEGVANIVTLLDAQRQSLAADLAAATALYRFFADMIAVQRATGGFDLFLSDEDRSEYLDSMQTFFEEHDYEP